MTHDELIEAVARAIADVTDFDGDRMASRYADSELRDVARAAIRVIAPAVERETRDRAAKAARDCAIYNGDHLINSDIRATCATAIRALKTRYEQ